MADDENRARTVILNANDGEQARALVTQLLEEAGYLVVEASSGVQALTQVESYQPDLIVLDLGLADLSGIEVCRRLREGPTTKAIKVLHTSATSVTVDVKVQSLDCGADGYLTQPFEPEELLATVRSLLRLSRTEQELRTSAEQLRDSDRRKNEFLAMLGHELRNPLAAMTASLPLIARREPLDQVERRARDVIGRQITHLARLIDDLLDVARVTQGKIELKWEVLDMCELLRRVTLNAEQTKTTPRRQQLRLELPEHPVYVRADATRLEQVFENLVDNASKYSDAGGTVRVTLAHAAHGGLAKPQVVVNIRDDGIGIAPSVLPSLFTLFAQADVPIARSRGGLGIGLTLVRTLVELHGGSVMARSEGQGRGSDFQVSLPELPTSERASDDPVSGVHKRNRRVSRKVLIIEDNADAQQVLRDLLELWGHDVACASDGLEGVRELSSFQPEIALVDIGLPGIDGYEVARQARSQSGGRRVLLVALTGYGAPEQRAAAIEAGFDLHLVKPVDPERLSTLLSHPPTQRSHFPEAELAK